MADIKECLKGLHEFTTIVNRYFSGDQVAGEEMAETLTKCYALQNYLRKMATYSTEAAWQNTNEGLVSDLFQQTMCNLYVTVKNGNEKPIDSREALILRLIAKAKQQLINWSRYRDTVKRGGGEVLTLPLENVKAPYYVDSKFIIEAVFTPDVIIALEKLSQTNSLATVVFLESWWLKITPEEETSESLGCVPEEIPQLVWCARQGGPALEGFLADRPELLARLPNLESRKQEWKHISEHKVKEALLAARTFVREFLIQEGYEIEVKKKKSVTVN